MLRSDGLCTDLPPQIHLNGSVDGDHIVVSADDVRVIHIVNGQNHDGGVIVDIVIDSLRAEGKCGYGFEGVDLFFAVVDRTAFDQLHHGIGEHLSVDAEIVLGFERHAGGIRDGPDA